jgi:hypothetical protein
MYIDKNGNIKRKKTVYETNYERLNNLTKGIDQFVSKDNELKLQSSGFMDLIVECNSKNLISLTHYYKQNGDLCPDPDMLIEIYPDRQMCEVISYQDTYGYKQVYPDYPSKNSYYPIHKKDLNNFLRFWLNNLKKQGFYK